MIILPNKHVQEKDSLLYAGAVVLNELITPKSVSELWNLINDNNSINNFNRFIAVLDMLYILGIIDFKNNKLERVSL